MLTFDDFPISRQERALFQDCPILQQEDVLVLLELYKCMTKEEVVVQLNTIDHTESYKVLNRAMHDARFREMEIKYSVIINELFDGELDVYAKAFQDVNLDRLEMEYPNYSLNLYRLTPLNYNSHCLSPRTFDFDMDILFKRILIEALRLEATDLHISVRHQSMKSIYFVACRCNNVMLDLNLFDLNENLNKELIKKLIEHKTDVNSIDLTDPSGIVASMRDPFGDASIELRIAANKVYGGYQCIIRIQQMQVKVPAIKELGFPEDVQGVLHNLAAKRSGITLLTGAPRTGKNTTANAVTNEMVKSPIKIQSYESPVEMLMPFTQIDYYGDQEILLNAVRLAKKQDINIAFINEIPNKEVAFAVQDLANSAIGVITTMHMDRLWHLPFKLQEYYGSNYKDVICQINAVINQKMFGVCCPNCQEMSLAEDLADKRISKFLKSHDIDRVYLSKGCASCSRPQLNAAGVVPGRNQPYCEYLLFSDKLKSDLLRCEYAFQMEELLKSRLEEQGSTLENMMLQGIREGKLPIDSLNYIL